LTQYFSLPGAFGDDSHDRRDLPEIAATRISKSLNLRLEPHQLIVIGDTPNDIACAKHFGARSVAVATGRSHSVDLLLSFGPDLVLESLEDTTAVLRALGEL
jgi:phosphoglycolate phosphatase-like HAD superfamily hydrolase